MKTSKRNSWMICLAAVMGIAVAFPAGLSGETAAAKSSRGSSDHATLWSVQVERVDSADLDVADSFQVAIYENLLTN